MRLLCKLFGCKSSDPYYPLCDRCSTDIYHWDFIDQSRAWLGWWYFSTWWLRCNRRRFVHKCAVCGRWMFFTSRECCSDECYDNWLPF
jgi:hypothetical protein